MLDCPFCNQDGCVGVIVETHTETTVSVINDEEDMGFSGIDDNGEIIDVDHYYQDVKFECYECNVIFKFKESCRMESYGDYEIFNHDQKSFFANKNIEGFIEV